MYRFVSAILIALLTTAFFAPAAPAQSGASEASYLNDPEWRKRFLGSYGFLSGAEPQIATTELEMLREVIELMKANPRAAAAMLQQQVNDDSSAALDFILANLEFQNGQLDSAKTRYETALRKFPDFRRAHKNLGLLHVQQGDCGGGLEHLTKAVELGDRDGRNFGLIGFCYLKQENALAAESAYRDAVLQEPTTRDWKLGLAQSLVTMERHREAIALFAELIKDNPEDATAWMMQANSYIGIDEPLAAAVNLEAVRAMGAAQSSSLSLLGDIYMNAGMPDLAKEAYLAVVARDDQGTEFSAAYRAAELLVRSRSYGDAADVLDSIEARYSEDLRAEDELKVLTLQAKVARAEGRPEEAARLLESIVQRDGTRGDALLELAAYHREAGDRDRALLFIERAQKVEAVQYQALLDHAQIMVASRDYTRAAELLREALAIQDEPRVARFLARVEESIQPD